jgi:hypothetical protein
MNIAFRDAAMKGGFLPVTVISPKQRECDVVGEPGKETVHGMGDKRGRCPY